MSQTMKVVAGMLSLVGCVLYVYAWNAQPSDETKMAYALGGVTAAITMQMASLAGDKND